ncbi:MAG: hypothetical protein QME81_14985 [bacterium]|nr:hypothetical protein [bacterium]
MAKTIPLITAIIALITAVLGLYKTYQQGFTLEQQARAVQQQQEEIEALRGEPGVGTDALRALLNCLIGGVEKKRRK